MDFACDFTNPIDHWRRNENLLPKLAKQILFVPASSAFVEQAFSMLRRMIGDCHTSMDSKSVLDIMKIYYSKSS